MLGDTATGKSSLVSQFMTSEYLHAYDTSIGELWLFIHWTVWINRIIPFIYSVFSFFFFVFLFLVDFFFSFGFRNASTICHKTAYIVDISMHCDKNHRIVFILSSYSINNCFFFFASLFVLYFRFVFFFHLIFGLEISTNIYFICSFFSNFRFISLGNEIGFYFLIQVNARYKSQLIAIQMTVNNTNNHSFENYATKKSNN